VIPPQLSRRYVTRLQRAHRYPCPLAYLPINLPPAEDGRLHVYHLFVIVVDGRDPLRAGLAAAGIETGIHYPIPLHRQPVLASLGYADGSFPLTERLAARSLSLPMYPELPVDQLDRVAAAVRDGATSQSR